MSCEKKTGFYLYTVTALHVPDCLADHWDKKAMQRVLEHNHDKYECMIVHHHQ